MDQNKKNGHYVVEGEIGNWQQALPLGNGCMGGLLYGKRDAVRLSVDDSSLWDLRLPKEIRSENFTFKRLCELVAKGESGTGQLTEEFESFYEKYPWPTRIPAGAVEFYPQEKADKIHFNLDMQTAEAYIQLNAETAKQEIRVHYNAVSFVGLCTISNGIECDLLAPRFSEESGNAENSLAQLGYEKCSFYRENGLEYFIQPIPGGNYGIFAAYKKYRGRTEIAFTVRQNADIAVVRTLLFSQLEKGYAACLREHSEWWNAYYQKSSIDIPDKKLQRLFDINNYLFASASREGFAPMSLQGVWTSDDGGLPPWKGDYHNDLNSQMAYSMCFKTNHIEEGLPYLRDYILKTKNKAKDFSKSFYGIDGLVLPSTTDIQGNPMGGWVQYSYTVTNHLWLCMNLYEWYCYTQDNRLLREEIFPYFVESAKTVMGLFVEKGGELCLPISSSPELNNNQFDAWFDPNTSFDIAILQAFFQAMVEFCGILQEDSSPYYNVLNHLPALPADESGIMINAKNRLSESHRHHSHCMAIYPLKTCHDPALQRRTVYRLKELGTSEWIGFSFVWAGAICAVAKDGDGALSYLRIYEDGFVSENGFHLNGDYKDKGYSNFKYNPFTLEACFGFNAAVAELMLQDHTDTVEIFPVDLHWGDYGFKGFLARGGYSAEKRADQVRVRINSKKPKHNLKVSVLGKSYIFTLETGENNFVLDDIGRIQ